MEENFQNSSRARSASEALSKIKEDRQRQKSTTKFEQTRKPQITRNAVPRNNNSNNSNDSGCGWILWFAAFFLIGVGICSVL